MILSAKGYDRLLSTTYDAQPEPLAGLPRADSFPASGARNRQGRDVLPACTSSKIFAPAPHRIASCQQEHLGSLVTAARTARRHSSLPVLVFFVTMQIVPGPLRIIVARKPVRFPAQQVVGVSVRDKYSSTSSPLTILIRLVFIFSSGSGRGWCSIHQPCPLQLMVGCNFLS
jgi:hypothetical protein